MLAGRGRGLLGALLVGVLSVGFALRAAYDAEALATGLVDAAAISQGRDVALVVLLCTLGALVGRTALLPLDTRLAALRMPVLRGRTKLGVGATVVVLAVVGALLVGAPAALERESDRFLSGGAVETVEVRDRLAEASANGRIEQWDVDLRGFELESVHGTGAGTYALQWDRYRPYAGQVEDGHALYLEVLGELGVVGLVLVTIPIVARADAQPARAAGPRGGAQLRHR